MSGLVYRAQTGFVAFLCTVASPHNYTHPVWRMGLWTLHLSVSRTSCVDFRSLIRIFILCSRSLGACLRMAAANVYLQHFNKLSHRTATVSKWDAVPISVMDLHQRLKKRDEANAGWELEYIPEFKYWGNFTKPGSGFIISSLNFLTDDRNRENPTRFSGIAPVLIPSSPRRNRQQRWATFLPSAVTSAASGAHLVEDFIAATPEPPQLSLPAHHLE